MSAKIPLSSGYFALVDEADLEKLSGYKWYAKRDHNMLYAVAHVSRNKVVLMHRLIMGDACIGLCVDHANRNGLDNRRHNLRACTSSQNQANRATDKSNKTGYKGVSFEAYRNKFRATISKHGKRINIGRFATAEQAARAYDVAAREIYGNFALLNFPSQGAQK